MLAGNWEEKISFRNDGIEALQLVEWLPVHCRKSSQ
jgi:hypothetical protein